MSRKSLRLLLLLVLDIGIYYGIYRGFFYLSEYMGWTYLPTLFTWVINIIIIYTVINILIKKDYNAYETPWLMVIAIAPLWGFILFMSFANDFRNSRRYKSREHLKDERYLLHEPESALQGISRKYLPVFKYTTYNTGFAIHRGNSTTTILSNGEEFFADLLEKIANAEKRVYMQFYIFKSDKIGRKIIELLIAKAKQGLDVRLLYDYLGGQDFQDRYIIDLKKYGVKVHAIDPILMPLFNTRVNYRNHRKIIVIDNDYAYTGGMNVGDEYIEGTKKYRWRDSNVRIEGKAVTSFVSLFARDYYYVTNDLIEDSEFYDTKDVEGDGLVQLLQSGPDTEPLIRNAYLKLISSARKSIKIQTPYLGLSSDMLLALSLAAKSGVSVEIIIPGIPDKKTVYMVTEGFVDDLLRNQVKVYKINGTFIHSKVIIVDDEIACCGTYNLDVRSAMVNFENTVLMYNSSVITLVNDFEVDRSNSTEINLETWKKRGLIKNAYTEIFKIFTPIT